nr:hypothetical protein GCM10020093_078410 [Planobispora longispora]
MTLVEQVHTDLEAAPVSDKMRALLEIAGAVQQGGRRVTARQVAAARRRAPRTWRYTTPC